MSENPYASDPDAQFDYYQEPQRTSLLAIFSLCSLLCCVPGIGVLGIVLGGLALLFISGSHGRLAGKGMAVTGLIVGIMVTTIHGAIGVGVLQVYTFYTKQMVPLVDTAVTAAAAGDLATVQSHFVNGEDITQEQITRFVAILEKEVGPVQGAYIEFDDLVEVFKQTYGGRSGNTSFGSGSSGDFAPVPVLIRGANGSILAWPIFDESTTNTGNLQMVDIVVQLPASTDSFSLRSSDIAKEVSIGLGSQMLRADETPDSIAPPSEPEAPGESSSDAQPAEAPSEPPV